MNKVILSGHTGKNPEVRYLENGSKVATFTVATKETIHDRQNSPKDITSWHRVVCWGEHADYAENNIAKGDFVYLEGRICYRSWEDRIGKNHEVTEIYVTELQSTRKKRQEPTKISTPVNIEISEPEDGLPF